MFDIETASQATKDMLIAADSDCWGNALDAVVREAQTDAMKEHAKGENAQARFRSETTKRRL